MYVSLEKLQVGMRLIDSLADFDQPIGPTGSSEFVLPGLAGLVGCDVATYQEISSDPDHLGYYTDFPAGSLDPSALMVFEAHLHEHPLLVHYRTVGGSGPAKISDFVSRQRFHRCVFTRIISGIYPLMTRLPSACPPWPKAGWPPSR